MEHRFPFNLRLSKPYLSLIRFFSSLILGWNFVSFTIVILVEIDAVAVGSVAVVYVAVVSVAVAGIRFCIFVFIIVAELVS